jgi:hypothetical protein
LGRTSRDRRSKPPLGLHNYQNMLAPLPGAIDPTSAGSPGLPCL